MGESFERHDAPLPALEEEILDRNDLPLADTRRALRDLQRVNFWLLGRRSLRVTLMPLLLADRGRPQTILDVAAGSGDSTAAMTRSAARRSVQTTLVSLDRKISHLVIGRQQGHVERAVVGNAGQLPFRDGSFDWVVSSLFFHHLDRQAKTIVAREMCRLARRGAVVIDLRRAKWPAWALRSFGPILGLGKIALGDGIVSISRSWTVDEWRVFLADRGAQLRRRFPARVSIVLPPFDLRESVSRTSSSKARETEPGSFERACASH